MTDQGLLRKLTEYTTVNPAIANAGLKALNRHLWYLSESLVGLALFDPAVPDDTKAAMVQAFEKPASTLVKRLDGQKLPDISLVHLEDLTSSRSLDLFARLQMDTSFLQENPDLWPNNQTYKMAQKRAHALRVVNDAAERGVALMTDYSKILTADEDQRQCILQVVETCRKQLKDTSKSALRGF